MFYSYYDNGVYKSKHGATYNFGWAYVGVCAAYMIVSLLIMVRNLATGFNDSVMEGGGLFYSWCNKVFASWDYCIEQEHAVRLKNKNIYKDFESELAEEARLAAIKNRTRLDTCKIYFIRIIVNILIVTIICLSLWAIIEAVTLSSQYNDTSAEMNPATFNSNSFVLLLKKSASSLTIALLNMVGPTLFNILGNFEKYSPRHYISFCLLRAVTFKIASVTVLMITLYTKYMNKEFECSTSWEDIIGGQMFNLILVDFIVGALVTITVETTRKYMNRYASCGCDLGQKIGKAEFAIPKNVLDLVYGQLLIWIGTYYAPLIPVMGVLKLIAMFYIKKISLVYNCKPSNDTYRGGRTNYFFTLLLILTFLLANVAIGFGMTKVPTSCHGPFGDPTCSYNKFMLPTLMKEVTDGNYGNALTQIVTYLKSAVIIVPLVIILILVLYYYRAMTHAQKKMINMLKDQLVMEGRDKRFLMDRLLRANEDKLKPLATSEKRAEDVRTESTGIGSGNNVKNISVSPTNMTSVGS
jgi:hypothetical protein